ncbi:mogroside IE synthase-like [Juglans microcarpa x Juglans regia]|uniref:mogroside IE synthase-like n=1 Tax=Juglans microcarpa x Juglans regia TaxID=2249226 RepID=UPI001B7ED58E|nr:mogroside IE synthase-like [Juglans microcarpa x Juglans regia]
MEKETSASRAHCLVLAYPAQGHINPLLEFSKRLEHKGSVKVTLVTTHFISKNMHKEASPIALEAISDGYDEGGIAQAENIQSYFERFRRVGSQTLTQLLEKLSSSGCPVNCIVYDAVLPWALDIAKKYGLFGAAFFTQACAVDIIYHHVHKGVLKLPLSEPEILLPGLPPLEPQDMPSFIYNLGSYPAFFDVNLEQFSNVHKADWVLCNTFYELEQEAVDWMSKIMPLRTVGPTIPSMFLDKRLEGDVDYGFEIFKPNTDACVKWLNDRPKGSVVYVSFGSMAALEAEQMQELAWGLRMSNNYFLWVVRASEEAKLPKNFVEETSEKGLVVGWCPQLEVLAHEAVGCFVTHCGWNSTLEAMSLGVTMVAMPQWTDQSTNAKYIMDFWKMGLKAPVDEKGLVRREAAAHCIREIMEGERGEEIKKNAFKWRKLAKEAVDKGGSSDKNIEEFVAKLVAGLP